MSIKYTLMHALLFGSLISAVDPVAVCIDRLLVELSFCMWHSYTENIWVFMIFLHDMVSQLPFIISHCR